MRILKVSIAVVIGMCVLAAPFVPVRQDRGSIDAVSGSKKLQTVWAFGITFGPTIDESPLELRMRQMSVRWNPDWRFLYSTHKTFLGTATLHECGSSPPIYRIGPILADFVRGASDQQIRQFARSMESGSEAEQHAAIEAAEDRVLPTAASANYSN